MGKTRTMTTSGWHNYRRWRPRPGLLLIAVLASEAMWAANTAKISKDLLKDIGSQETRDVIVQMVASAGDADFSRIAGAAGLKLKMKSGHMGVFKVHGSRLNSVADDPAVLYVSPDRTVSGKLEFAEPAVNANIAFQSGWTGAGIGIAIVDSGIAAEHPDLRNRVVYEENFVEQDNTTDDLFGHGTHVAAIAGGNGSASTGPSYIHTFRGIAPRANLISLRVLNRDGQGTDSAVISAIDRAIQLRDQYNIRVLNLSLGRLVYESYMQDPLCQAVERAWRAGIVVVVAAGNYGRDNSMSTRGYSTITSPGNDPFVITVGAARDMGTASRGDDLVASYSSKGPTLLDQIVKPDLIAPGDRIVSALAPGGAIKSLYPQNVVAIGYYKNASNSNDSSSYFRLSGTSMAAPIVSGAAALVLQKQSWLTPDQVKARLMKTASKSFPATSTISAYNITYDLFTVGAGYLDVAAALSSYDAPPGNALSPRAIYDPARHVALVVPAAGSVWNSSPLWGNAIVWGTNVLSGTDALSWGSGIVWSSDADDGFAIVWGTAIVWGSNQPSPDTVSSYGDQ